MQLQYELFRKEQEKLIKDMERSVFKRETIQLKYMPKVEKKLNEAQDPSSTPEQSKKDLQEAIEEQGKVLEKMREKKNLCLF